MIIGKESIISYYEYFYSRKYGNKDYKFKPSEKADQSIDKFLSTLDGEYKLVTLGNNFLSRYFSFQFSRLDGQVFKRFSSANQSGRVNIYDIIGIKAFNYWKDRNKEFDFQLNNIIDDFQSFNVDSIKLNKSEEIEKSRFANENRLANCLEKTTLFNHRSSICIACNEQRTCKMILKNNYPQIFEKRGYGTTVK